MQMNIQIKKTQPGQYGGCNGRAQMTRFNKCLEYAELIIGYTSKMSGAHQEEDFNRHKSKLLFRSFTHMQYALSLQYFKGSRKHATLMQGFEDRKLMLSLGCVGFCQDAHKQLFLYNS